MKKTMIGLGAMLTLTACNTEADSLSSGNTVDNQEANEPVEVNQTNENEGNSHESTDQSSDSNETKTQNSSTDWSSLTVHEFDLDLEFESGEEWEYEYERQDEAEIERENGESVEIHGEEAVQEIEALIAAIQISSDRTPQEMMNEVLEELQLNPEEIVEFDIDVEYDNDETVKFKYERLSGSEDKTVHDFSLDLEFFNSEEWAFDYERDDQEAEVERENGEETKITGPEAMEIIETLLSKIDIRMDRTIEEMKIEVLRALDLNPEDIKEFDLDIEYADDEEINIEHDLS